MSYIARPPSARLAGIVERLWRVEDHDANGVAATICPDGCAEIVVHLDDPMQGQPRHLLVGQMNTPLTVIPAGRVKMLGARFTPSGLSRVLPMPQDRLAGRVIALDDVWRLWTRETADRVASAGDVHCELRAFEISLESLVAVHERVPDLPIEKALSGIRRRGGPVSVDLLARASGLRRRQFERRFRDRVGLPPHLYGRIVRFQRAFAAISREPGAAVAARLEFVDQAHLIREVRHFSGQTPTLLAGAEGLTSFFVNAARARR